MSSSPPIRLGVNIDHIATLRNARGGVHPDPVAGALRALAAGAHGITAHLREDRRHVRDEDIFALKQAIDAPLNFEMAATDEMVAIACDVHPNACCLVPERREERTTEGGLNVAADQPRLKSQVRKLQGMGARVSLFVTADASSIQASADVGADIVELHTGELAHAYADDPNGSAVAGELDRLARAAQLAAELGLEVHAGHGLNYGSAKLVAALPQIVELNIGHFLMGEAVLDGMDVVIERFLTSMAEGVAQRATTTTNAAR